MPLFAAVISYLVAQLSLAFNATQYHKTHDPKALVGHMRHGICCIYFIQVYNITSWGHKLRQYATPISNRGGKF